MQNVQPSSTRRELIHEPNQAARGEHRCYSHAPQGFKEFLPPYQVRWFKWVDLPLLPDYFILLTITELLHFLGIGKTPAPVHDEKLRRFELRFKPWFWAELWAFLNVGQRVRIEEGPLTCRVKRLDGDRPNKALLRKPLWRPPLTELLSGSLTATETKCVWASTRF
jgi:hypothetical protein